MLIRNTRRTLLTLEYKQGNKFRIVPIAAGKEVIIPELIDFSQIISKQLFNNGYLIAINDMGQQVREEIPGVIEVAEEQVKKYSEVDDKKEVSEDKHEVQSEENNNRKKAKSKENKNKKSE